MRWQTSIVAVIAAMLATIPINAASFVCKVTNKQTEITNGHIKEYSHLRSLIAMILNSLPESKREELLCSANGRAILGLQISYLSDIQQALASSQCPAAVLREYEQYHSEATKFLSGCPTLPKVPQAGSNQKCSVPKPPLTVLYTDRSCITALNTNSNPRCIYSFTYSISSNSRPQPGGTVKATESIERCTQIPGDTIKFEKWTNAKSPAP